VDLDAVASNLKVIRVRTGGSRRVIAVVKADAYGHGAIAVARRLEKEGADAFGVAMVEEGLELRRAGITRPVLILGAFMPAQIPQMVEGALTPSVYSMTTLNSILEARRHISRAIPFHLKIDTGMGRLGLTPAELGPALDRIAALPEPALDGVFTTLTSGDQENETQTADQLRVFSSALEAIRRRGLQPHQIHAANSGGLLLHPSTWFDMVRPGLALYGLAPAGTSEAFGLKPALSLRARIVLLKTVNADTPLGYGGAFRTIRPSRIATIAAGYDDGVNRLVHDGGEVIVHGKRAPFAGRISMDFSMVDVTDVQGVAEGDEATIIGTDGDTTVTAWDTARLCGTIPYEILCHIGARVPRVYLGEGATRPIRSRFE